MASRSDKDEFADASTDERMAVFSNGADSFRVGVKVPPFWPQEPAVWFAQLEGQFVLSNITSDATKFYYVLSQLEHQYAAEVKDIIISPPVENKYDKLKSELIKRLSASREKDLKNLLIHEELGDRKPSQFLRHLQHKAGPSVPEDFLKTLWTNRLPLNLQSVIASQPTSTLDSLAELADRVWDISPGTPQVASTSSNSQMDLMAKQISALTQQMQTLTTEVRSSRAKHQRGGNQRRARSSNRRQGRNHSRSQSSYRKYPICWYHSKFKSQSTKCIKPCDFHSGNSLGNR